MKVTTESHQFVPLPRSARDNVLQHNNKKDSTIPWKSGNLNRHSLVLQKIGTYKSNYFVSFIKNAHVYKMYMYTIPGICKKYV